MSSIVGAIRKRIAGVSLIALGVLVLTMPLVVGQWSLAILGLPLIALAIAEAYIAFRSPRGSEASAYLPSALAFLAGNVLLLSSALVGQGLLVLLIAILTVDGVGKIIAGFRLSPPSRLASVLNGLFDLGCAAMIWYLSRFIGIVQAIGIIVGVYIVAAGWRSLMVPDELIVPDTAARLQNVHADPRLGIPGNDRFALLRSKADDGSQFVLAADLLWMSTLGIVFLAIHAGRMPLTDDMLGRISPFVATVGDVLMTLVFATAVMLPARLRRLYAVNAGIQRAPFFELQTDDFALLAIDTGILRTVDQRQLAWIERALDRSRGKFTLAIVGHPRFAGGHDIPPVAAGQDFAESSEKFAALYRLLATRNVKIVMAGDTHDFEYYRENVAGDGAARVMHHFVNGGGGAYLSIGTALDFPKQPVAADWAYYPRTDQLRAKMDAEMPLWKQPFWYWIKWFNAWPFSVEAFSGIFDFNRAPFFQSFMEVRVERSKKRVVVILNGVHGPLQWRDLQSGGAVMPPDARPDDRVEFIVSMDRQ